jgi:predicted SnoaL-like aldol condensation-catalyzing enzyme
LNLSLNIDGGRAASHAALVQDQIAVFKALAATGACLERLIVLTAPKGRVMNKDQIRQVLDVIYDQVFNQGRADLYPGLVAGPYIQHNPMLADGVDGVMAFLKQAGRIRNEVKRIAIDGDLAFVHARYLDLFGQETAGVDIFRFDDAGKIVEHWDVLQPVPAEAKNTNTMF